MLRSLFGRFVGTDLGFSAMLFAATCFQTVVTAQVDMNDLQSKWAAEIPRVPDFVAAVTETSFAGNGIERSHEAYEVGKRGNQVYLRNDETGRVRVVGPKHTFDLQRDSNSSDWFLVSPPFRTPSTLQNEVLTPFFSSELINQPSPEQSRSFQIVEVALTGPFSPYRGFRKEGELVNSQTESIDVDGKALTKILFEWDGEPDAEGQRVGSHGYLVVDPTNGHRIVNGVVETTTGRTRREIDIDYSPDGKRFETTVRRMVKRNESFVEEGRMIYDVQFDFRTPDPKAFELASYGIQLKEEKRPASRLWILLVVIGVLGLISGIWLNWRQSR